MIRHVFFDLDHTLWDFDANAAATLRALHDAHSLGAWFGEDEFVASYTRINHAAWARFHRGEITQLELRVSRFADTFRDLGADPTRVPPGLGEAFIRECSGRSLTLPHAHEVLIELARRGYQLHIVTNGFRDSQHRKLAASGLDGFFAEVITTDCIGCAKPDTRIYAHALARAGAAPHESWMVGDSLDADALGALTAGWAGGVWFNVGTEPSVVAGTVTHEIADLRELLAVLPGVRAEAAR